MKKVALLMAAVLVVWCLPVMAADFDADGTGEIVDDRGINPFKDFSSKARILKRGNVRLKNRDSYHFLTGRTDYLGGGDFYVKFYDDQTVKFHANNSQQRGIVDLGHIEEKQLEQVKPPSDGYTRRGVEAVKGHTYVSKAKGGEEGNYIVFRILHISAISEWLTLEWIYIKGEDSRR